MADRICSLCGQPAIARGWCTLHYQRWRRHGDPEAYVGHPGPRTDAVDRFWSKVDRRGDDECWPWLGGVDRDGYGYFKVGGRMWRAQRYVFNLAHPDAPIGDDEMTRHTCDNPPCVNPRHLLRGDALLNMADQVERDRTARGDRHGSRKHPETVRRGSDNSAARLTEEQVIEIRRRYAAGEKQVPLSAEFGISQITVSLIVRRRTWTHLKE